jgi:nitroimidazol reductase NimA-like FMN-containing flavoprotein (pyridoxamine 5'-phosphate oxidase superfamily)
MPDEVPLEPRVEVLTREECIELLGTVSIGRVAVAQADDPPLVVPVNFVLDRDVVVFRSDAGTKLLALRQGAISFEVDDVDPFHRTGWSVLVHGAAYEATHWEVDHLELAPWAGGDKRHWIRLVPKAVSGRRIRLAEVVEDPRGYL